MVLYAAHCKVQTILFPVSCVQSSTSKPYGIRSRLYFKYDDRSYNTLITVKVQNGTKYENVYNLFLGEQT